jgi:hypothetical protein
MAKTLQLSNGTGCTYLGKGGTTWIPTDTLERARDTAWWLITQGEADSVNIYQNWETLVETIKGGRP